MTVLQPPLLQTHTITVAHMVHSHTDSDSRGSSTFILLPDVLSRLAQSPARLLEQSRWLDRTWTWPWSEVRSISRLFSLLLLLWVPLRTCLPDDWSVRTDWCVCTVSLSPGCVWVCVCVSVWVNIPPQFWLSFQTTSTTPLLKLEKYQHTHNTVPPLKGIHATHMHGHTRATGCFLRTSDQVLWSRPKI